MATPEISVVIPAYRAEAILPACLRALGRQSLARDSYEIIVIDDGSPDQTAKAARPLADRVITVPNGGPGIARNIGAEAARGPLLVFTDADCVPEEHFLEHLAAPLRAEPDIVAAKGSYLTRQRSLAARFVQAEYEDRYRYMGRHAEIDFIDTYAAIFRREVFLSYGGYSPLFPTASVEDQEFGFRLAADGLRMVFCPEAQVWHRHADSLWAYARKKHKIAFWKVLVLKLHPTKTTRDTHTPQRVKLHLLVTPLALLGLGGWALGAFSPWWLLFPLASLALERQFLRELAPRDPLLALATPVFVWGRSLAFAVGLVWGSLLFASFDVPQDAPSQETK